MPKQEILLDLGEFFTPHPVQDYILSSRARWICLECGRRFGKGRAAVFWLIWNYLELMRKPRPESLVPTVHINVIVPTLTLAAVPWLELLKFIPDPLIRHVDESDKVIKLAGGGLIELKSGDKRATLQASGLDMLWITEADKIDRAVWYDLIPMLRSQDRAGLAWIESKPYNEMGWFHELYQKGLDPSDQLESFHFSTFANPHINWEELYFDKEIMLEADWRREYLAEIEGGSEAAFPFWKNNLLPDDFEAIPHDNHIYQIGVDLGKQMSYSTIAVFDLVTREVVHLDRWQTSWDETRARIANISRRWKTGGIPSTVYIDATGKGVPVVEDLRKEYPDIPLYDIVLNHANRFVYLSRLALAIEKGDIKYPDWGPLRKELARMKRMAHSPHDLFKAPAGQTDDLIFALALAYNKETVDGSVRPCKNRNFMRT